MRITSFPCIRAPLVQVGSTLDRFLHAEELLRLWRHEEAIEDQMENGDEVSKFFHLQDYNPQVRGRAFSPGEAVVGREGQK